MKNITAARLIEFWASSLLEQYEKAANLPPQIPIPVFDIAERFLHLRVDLETLLGEFVNASALQIPSKRWIIINRNQSLQRQAFTLAHEIAHCLIDFEKPCRDDRGLAHPSGLRSAKPHLREVIANRFAAALLIPKDRLLECCSGLKEIDSRGIQRLADTFQVPYSAMHIRLQEVRNNLECLGIRFSIAGYSVDRHLSERKPIFFNQFRYTVARVTPADYNHCTFIDHNVLRKLSLLKKETQELFILCDNQSEVYLETLLAFDCVDGFVIAPSPMPKTWDETSSNRDGHLRFVNVECGGWVSEFSLGISQKGDDDLRLIFTRSQDDQLICDQPRLIEIGRFVVAPEQLNYRKEARAFIQKAKSIGKRVVIVTGCFDLLTDAHVKFLRRAKSNGDLLVVGIEADNRVRAFKGSLRPVNTISQRVEVIDALEFVDFTFVIHGSPKTDIKVFYTRLHRFLQADILAVSEGDPHLQDRRDEIEAGGGSLEVVSRQELNSTTSLIRRFLRETEYSDLVIVTKGRLKAHILESETTGRQLALPLVLKD